MNIIYYYLIVQRLNVTLSETRFLIGCKDSVLTEVNWIPERVVSTRSKDHLKIERLIQGFTISNQAWLLEVLKL